MASKYKIGAVTDIPAGYSKCFEIEERRIAVFHVDGAFYAIDDACPHAGAPLSESIPEENHVTCFWHGATFDLKTGRCTVAGAFPDVQAYPIHIENSELFIELP